MKRYRAPGEDETHDRAWRVVKAAFERRERVTWPRSHVRPLVAAAAVAAAVAALLSPPGRSFIDTLRKSVGVQHAQKGLFSLPGGGLVLVQASSGLWVVHPDGSKRRLAGYDQASWSPHGLYLVAHRKPNELVALDDRGNVHWTLTRPGIRFPSWGGTLTDTRIAYASGRKGAAPAVRVVGGDGRGDHWVTKDFLSVAPAWQPGPRHVLAVAHTDDRVRLWATDTRSLVATTRKLAMRPLQLSWSGNGAFLYVLTRGRLYLFDEHARLTAIFRLHQYFPGAAATALAVAPRGNGFALVLRRGRRSEVVGGPEGLHRVFSGAGHFTGLQWSPDGRWLLVAWKEANQWLFIRSARVKKIRAVSAIASQFESENFPTVGGWCCAR